MMEPPLPADLVFPNCTQGVTLSDRTCPHCDATLATGTVPLAQNPKMIVALMVFVALFLTFPLLWRSRYFSLPAKVFWTLFVLIETAVLFSAAWWSIARLVVTLRREGFL